jgi:hypothetical protein
MVGYAGQLTGRYVGPPVWLPGTGADTAYPAGMRRFLPSPALVVATLALALSAGGASYAATKIGTRDLEDDAVTSSKIKDGVVSVGDLRPGVAAAMGVRAYGSVAVSQGVSLESARTDGFSKVVRPETGVYCLTLSDAALDPGTTSPVVTVDWDDSTGANLTAYLSKSAHECPAGADLGVRTFTFTAGRPYKPSDNVAFTILVP